MTDKRKKLLQEYILKQITSLGNTVSKNFKGNQLARTKNPFLCFSGGIDKFLGLGRSIDSQLGSRMQNIIFYLSRLRYGDECVPNIVVVNANITTLQVSLRLYYTEGILSLDKFYANKNPCKQKIYFNQTLSDADVKSAIGTKLKVDIIKDRTITFFTAQDIVNEIIGLGTAMWPVDLLFIDSSKTPQTINTFEIKMSGYIDTKNAASNADEVQRLFDAFKCSGANASYFAVCYGECADAVKNRMKTNAAQCKTLTAVQFWNVVLPNAGADALTYEEFVEIYKQAFVDSKLEQTIKDL